MAGWYIEKGPESDVAVSSRVRLARNLKNFPFPPRMSREQEEMLIRDIRNAALDKDNNFASNLAFIDITGLSPIDRQALMEKHIISRDMAESQNRCGVLVGNDEKISIMINEEDHLRIQCMFPGMQMDKAWKLCNDMDTYLEGKVEYAYNDDYGYLTCCPTNIGTGMRASVMLHLPALTMTGYIKNVLEACGKISVAVRGLYGENSEASGNMFQISNQISLGQTEGEIINNITGIASQLIEQERLLRKELYNQNPYRFEDRIYRSLGVFSNARIMTSEEAHKLLSDVRLGVNMGIIKDIKIEMLNELMILIQPGNLQKYAARPLNPGERDIIRAEIIRKMFGNSNT
ncbi:protein arginine kinase [Clostridium thermosuccinogenes]|uniref:Protein-arginine kinase n=1 Tax=Clostridium thermosuccinogenes TaxID=84032 RepID=A0A2K2F9H0_9CLOT|nr:protein arginine kinase [Pseudoclostridium thermosuccinogenes]AUS95572.1 protein arginine kinase [Pseudoclostridium thermosuccinogenes]PNT94797.1 protein arginine kinase [Pseudoclostridium thermosuccinogenes]PNT95425.1 protein arginine kinase [Pseudoclostridium thermosuccinogenes]